MKKNITTIIFALFLLNISFSQTQTRYIDEVFDAVDVTDTVKYADNMSVVLTSLGVPYAPTGTNTICPDLVFDFYEPQGDTEMLRPLLIFLHTGTFGPIYLNGNPTGSRKDYATTKMCNDFAKRGYTVANLEYRLGWNGGTGTLEENSLSLMLAVYRAIQDTKAAVRYFYKDAKDNGNTYKIDTNRIAIVGQGSGGWVGLGYAAVKDTADLQLSKFLDADGNMLIQMDTIGDWDGYGGYPGVNMENNVGYSDDIKMVCSIGGGMGALDWLDVGDVPIAAVHCRTDPTAIYTTGDVSVPTPGDSTFTDITTDISGSYDVIAKSNMLGNNDAISGITDAYTNAANNASLALVDSLDMFGQTIGAPVENLFPFNTGNPIESAPWEFWIDSITEANAPLVGGNAEEITAKAYGFNPNMSIMKSHAYIDSIMGFFCPRIVNALMLPGNNVNINNQVTNSEIKVYPNPSNGDFNFSSSSTINQIRIFDQFGKIVKVVSPNSHNYNLVLDYLPTGFYSAEIKNKDGFFVEKIIIK
jgi:hypothetical protein